MKPYKWRTANAAYRYVDGDTGSDLQGAGTQINPYQTLRRAWDATPTKPTLIICRGYFSEDMADGNHACAINGDYMGAAVFDGNDQFCIYGFGHSNMIIKNCITGSESLNVHNGSGLFAGAGRASAATYVGSAISVNGVVGSPAVLDNTGLYWGVVGGTTAVHDIVYSRLKSNSTHPISLGGYANQSSKSLSICGVRIINRKKKFTTGNFTYYSSIFADFDMFIDEPTLFMNGCLIAADCKWYYGSTEIVITGTTSAERENSLLTQAATLGATSLINLEDCKFSTQTKNEIFNNPDKLDYTLKLTGDGVIGSGMYYGALPPALDIPIMNDSAQTPETWDENSVSGCVNITENTICLDDLHVDNSGEILSKVLRLNPTEININAIFADFSSKFRGYHANLSDTQTLGLEFDSTQDLPIGKYVIKGAIVYNGNNYGQGSILSITTASTKFTDTNSHSRAIEILDPNITNVVYVRELPYIFVRIEPTDGLQRGATYYNYSNENITYRGRTIVPGESFVAANDVDSFTCSPGYKIGVLFDDTRVPSSEWIPSQLWGEYFVWKQGGTVQVDTEGKPVSSGNYLSYQTSANGGYSNLLIKSILTTTYAQFKVVVNKFQL